MKTNFPFISIIIAVYLIISYVFPMDFFVTSFVAFLAVIGLRLSLFRVDIFKNLSKNEKRKIRLNINVCDYSAAIGCMVSVLGVSFEILPGIGRLIVPFKTVIAVCFVTTGISMTITMLIYRKGEIWQ